MSLLLLLASTPSPTKDLTDPVDVSPGLIGFLATFALVVATVLLLIDMSRRVRRLRFRQRKAEAAARESAAQRAAAEGAAAQGAAAQGEGARPADDSRPPDGSQG